jgi:hypothetical protein
MEIIILPKKQGRGVMQCPIIVVIVIRKLSLLTVLQYIIKTALKNDLKSYVVLVMPNGYFR